MLSLVPVLRQQFHELINGKSQTKRDRKSSLLYLQPDNIERLNLSLLKIETKFQKIFILTILDTSQLILILKIFTV